MRWQIKFARNAVYGLMPFPDRLRSIKRRIFPYPTEIPEWTLEEGFRQVEMLRAVGCDLQDKVLLEVGTGWQPIIPLLYAIAGCRQQILVDAQRLLDQRMLFATIGNMAARSAQIVARLKIDESLVRQRLQFPRTSLEQTLKVLGLDYRAPYDLTRNDLPDESIDVICSRAVLEHIPPAVLRELLGRLLSALKPGGLSCHLVDNSDHWSHTDQRLSRLDFLRYNDRTFDVLCRFNPLDYQNRLRHSEYLELFKSLGYEIRYEKAEIDAKALEKLASLPLAARFRDMSHEELAKTDSHIVAARPQSATKKKLQPAY